MKCHSSRGQADDQAAVREELELQVHRKTLFACRNRGAAYPAGHWTNGFGQSLREKMSIENRLKELGIELPASAPAGAAYTPVVIHERVAYVSGQLPRDGDRVHVVGQVGRDVSLEEGKRGARLAFIRALAALRGALGTLDGIDRMLKLTVFVHSATDFNQQSAVADGASELIFELFGKERGAHARTSVGVAQLPRSAAIEVEIIVALK
jgi:enamine deaminase RidA (YjgF/YER057c/UK114 family)